MAASTNSDDTELSSMSDKTRLLFDQLDRYLTDRLHKSKNTDPLLNSYHPIPALRIDVKQLQQRRDSYRTLNGSYQNEDASDFSSGRTEGGMQVIHKMKTDFETEEDAEVAKYLDTALEVQPGLNWRLLALRRQASIRNGRNSYANCSAAPKTNFVPFKLPGSATLGTNQSDVDSQYVRKRLEREQKQRLSQQQLIPGEKRNPNKYTTISNGDSGNHGNISFQDLRAQRPSYSFRETSRRRSSSAVPNDQSDQASMLSGEKSVLESRRITGPAVKSDVSSALQRRLAYDPVASKMSYRPTKKSTDKSSSALSSPEVKPQQNQASKGTVRLRRSATLRITNGGSAHLPSASASSSSSTPFPATPMTTNGRPAVNGQVSSRKETCQRISSPTTGRLSLLSPPPPPSRGLPNGLRSRLSSVPKGQIRVSAHAASDEQSRGQANGQPDPLRQNRKEETDKPLGQSTLQRMDSKNHNSKERQTPERLIDVNSVSSC
uniref:Uncharacterized protein n=1 Tax=Schistocephalus solidus TaxID=70667 RepID=A0A0X3NTZ8_SCHSO